MKVLGWTAFATKNNCVDEFYPLTLNKTEFDRIEGSRAGMLMIGYGWIGSNVFGLYWNTFCILGLEYRFGDEPTVSAIVWNRGLGIWKPDEE